MASVHLQQAGKPRAVRITKNQDLPEAMRTLAKMEKAWVAQGNRVNRFHPFEVILLTADNKLHASAYVETHSQSTAPGKGELPRVAKH